MKKIIRDNYAIYLKTFEINGQKKVVRIKGDIEATPEEIEKYIKKELDYMIYKEQQKAYMDEINASNKKIKSIIALNELNQKIIDENYRKSDKILFILIIFMGIVVILSV